jgi:hypothetical protein
MGIRKDSRTDPLLNLAVALVHARSKCIRYLLVDIMSLDQSLSVDVVFPQVVAFEALYTKIPVIAAYDDPRPNLEYITLQPWISSEIELMRKNPDGIAYIGHKMHQRTYVHMSFLQENFGWFPRSRKSRTAVVKRIEAV